MRAVTAAAYLDVSEQTFLDRVKAGTYPPGVRDGSVHVWLRDDLDVLIERQLGIADREGGSASAANDDPFAARFGKTS